MGKHDIVAKYNVTCSMLDYEALVSDIPRKWKQMLIEYKSLNNNYHEFHECTVIINKQVKQIIELSMEDVYWHFVSFSSEHPKSETKWNEKLRVLLQMSPCAN